jgi:hypothetical protein
VMSLSQRWSGPSAVKIGLTRSSWTGVTQEAPHREESGGAQLLRAGLGGRRDEPNRIRATYRTGPGIRLVTDGTSGLPIWVASPGVSPGPTRSIPRSGHGSAGHTERGSDRSGELVDTVGRGCRRWCRLLGQWSYGARGSRGQLHTGRRLAQQIVARLRAAGMRELSGGGEATSLLRSGRRMLRAGAPRPAAARPRVSVPA